MKLKFLLFAFCVLSLGLLTTSCNDDDDDNREIGVLIKNPSNSWRKALTYYAEKSLLENGLINSAYIRSAKNGTEQAKQLKEAYDRGCRVIVLSPEGIDKNIVEEYIGKGVKFILSEEELVESYTSYIYTDNTSVGKNAAQFIMQKEMEKVALFHVKQDLASSNGRIKGFLDHLLENETLLVAERFELDYYTREDGKEAALEVLQDPSFDAIYAQDDEVALGVLDAIKETGSTNIKIVIGCGGSQDFFQRIKETTDLTLATTLYSPSMMGKCVDVAALILKGNQVDKKYPIDPTVISSENVASYFDPNSPY